MSSLIAKEESEELDGEDAVSDAGGFCMEVEREAKKRFETSRRSDVEQIESSI
jgi:hypothetical protein